MKIKFYLLVLIMSLAIHSCSDGSNNPTLVPTTTPETQYKTVQKVIKDLKESTEQSTNYHYKYDWYNGKFRQQPNIHTTTTTYYFVYTDGTYDVVSKERFIVGSKGDTIEIKVKL